jgi:salicylate hydroxylase
MEWNVQGSMDELLDTYRDFHPGIVTMLKFIPFVPSLISRKAQELKHWKLLSRAPISTWIKGKTILIGDAAHPMLPRSSSCFGKS